MRSVFAALALGVMSCGNAAASSFEIIGEAQAVSAPIGSAGSSIVTLGEPAGEDAAASKPLDGTETSSIDARTDAAPRARPTAAKAMADWARVSSTQSPSLLYFGTPDPEEYKLPEPEVAAVDPAQIPMVMRGGIEGGAFSMPAANEKKDAATDETAGDEKPADTTADNKDATKSDTQAADKPKPDPKTTEAKAPDADKPKKAPM